MTITGIIWNGLLFFLSFLMMLRAATVKDNSGKMRVGTAIWILLLLVANLLWEIVDRLQVLVELAG